MGRLATTLAIACVLAIAGCSADRATTPAPLASSELGFDVLSDSTSGAVTSSDSIPADTATWDTTFYATTQTAGYLLGCPGPLQTVSTSRLIGPEGGVLERGPFELAIPPGALPDTQLVTLTRPAVDYLMVYATVGDSAHYEFQKQVEFTVHVVKHCPDVTLEMLKYLSGVWLDAPNGLVSLTTARNLARGRLKFGTDHFSSYGIAW